MGLLLFYLFKKYDPGTAGAEGSVSAKNTIREFMPFETIDDNMIIMPDHKYRVVLACTSTNYHLKTDAEKGDIETFYHRFLNSVKFPITFFLQTKVIDNTDRLKEFRKEIEATLTQFPNMAGYAEQHLIDMANLNTKLGNSQQKHRYIIIPYDDVGDLSELSDSEKSSHASEELRLRASVIRAGLEPVGVGARMLNTEELIELIYSSYHRDDYAYANEIAKGGCFSLFVKGKNDHLQEVSHSKLVDIIVGGAIKELASVNSDGSNYSKDVCRAIEDVRKKYSEGDD